MECRRSRKHSAYDFGTTLTFISGRRRTQTEFEQWGLHHSDLALGVSPFLRHPRVLTEALIDSGIGDYSRETLAPVSMPVLVAVLAALPSRHHIAKMAKMKEDLGYHAPRLTATTRNCHT